MFYTHSNIWHRFKNILEFSWLPLITPFLIFPELFQKLPCGWIFAWMLIYTFTSYLIAVVAPHSFSLTLSPDAQGLSQQVFGSRQQMAYIRIRGLFLLPEWYKKDLDRLGEGDLWQSPQPLDSIMLLPTVFQHSLAYHDPYSSYLSTEWPSFLIYGMTKFPCIHAHLVT